MECIVYIVQCRVWSLETLVECAVQCNAVLCSAVQGLQCRVWSTWSVGDVSSSDHLWLVRVQMGCGNNRYTVRGTSTVAITDTESGGILPWQ